LKPTLLILAAGMGSRYGGLKQIDPFGPHGETLMDYAIYDALAAGFARVVFVIRRDFEAEFRQVVGSKYENHVAVDYAFQGLDDLPSGFSCPADRRKPWGTTQAIWCARGCVDEPFVSLNADDYYGKSAFVSAAQFLAQPTPPESSPCYCVVGYPVLQTLSEHGPVARGICELDDQGYLRTLVERKRVEKVGDTGRFLDEQGGAIALRGDEAVSMNMMGFTPAVFPQLERHFARFLEQHVRTADSELVIPTVVDQIVREGSARMRVLTSRDSWFGVTYAKDKPEAVESIRRMIDRKEYPSPIWSRS